MSQDYHDTRRDETGDTLEEAAAGSDPYAIFSRWMEDAHARSDGALDWSSQGPLAGSLDPYDCPMVLQWALRFGSRVEYVAADTAADLGCSQRRGWVGGVRPRCELSRRS